MNQKAEHRVSVIIYIHGPLHRFRKVSSKYLMVIISSSPNTQPTLTSAIGKLG